MEDKYKYVIVAALVIIVIAAIAMMANNVKVDMTGLEISDSDWEISKTANGYTLEMYIPELAGNNVTAYYSTGYATKVAKITERVNEDGSVTMIFPSNVDKITMRSTK